MNYSGGQYNDPKENLEDDYDQPYAHIDELDDSDQIEDHDNEEDYYPLDHNNDDDYHPTTEGNHHDYPDDGSHQYHKLEDVKELSEEEFFHVEPRITDEIYESEPDDDDDKPQFPSIDSEQYWTPNKSPENSYHTAEEGPYEDLEDYCCTYCAGQHPDNWCLTPHYQCLDTCLVPEDHPHYIDDDPVDATCPAEG
jgi:hypothetical protein